MRKVFEQAMRNKAARAAAQQSPEGITHVRKGPFGLSSRNAPITPRIARMIAQAQANMPAAGGPIMAGDVDAMMGRSAQDDMSAMKKGGKVKKMAKGGSTASKRADGCATKGKTRGKLV